ncbi:MAG: hemolysin-like calcium-binding protein [Rhizobium sp.]|nr:hemolysin-like calcium-binding protein [Rhizobium sp.]
MTIHGDVKFTLDGKTKFKVGDETFQWNNRRIDLVNIWSDDNETYTNMVTLKGADWGISTLRFVGDAHMKTVIKDGDTQDGRHIEYILAGNAGSTVKLKSTEVGLLAGSNAVDKVTTGSGRVDTIYLYDGNDVVKVGSGSVGSIYTSNGNDKVTMGDGGVDQIVLGDGNNTFTGGGAWVGSLLSFKGNDTMKMAGTSADQISMGDGKNTFVGGSEWVGALRGGNGIDTVTVKDGSVETINVGHGENTINITGSGWVASVVAYDDKDVLNITGTGQVGSINLGSGDNIIQTGSNWVGSIITYEDNDTVTIGAGGAELVTMGHGNNTLVATGWVGAVQAYSGNDTVTLGVGGAGHVALYGGDDTVHVSETTDDGTVMLDGGAGTDTVDFGSFGIAVQISLSDPIEYVAGPAIFVVTGFENLTTGSGADELIGNSVANILNGGQGNDSLTGNGGADTFVFASGDGDDTVEDFDAAENDVIDLSAVTQITDFSDLSANHMDQVGSDVVIDNEAGDTITLKDVAIADLTAGRFLF